MGDGAGDGVAGWPSSRPAASAPAATVPGGGSASAVFPAPGFPLCPSAGMPLVPVPAIFASACPFGPVPGSAPFCRARSTSRRFRTSNGTIVAVQWGIRLTTAAILSAVRSCSSRPSSDE